MRIRIVFFLVAVALAGGIGYLAGGAVPASHPPLKNLGKSPEFAFTDSSERPFGSADLKGKVWVLNFFFTSCKGPCPKLIGEVRRLAQDTGGRAEFVSVTSDPETDTAPVLAKYKEELGAEKLSWHFLTAPQEQIVALARTGLGFATGEPSLHTTKLILVDKKGVVRGFFSSDFPDDLARLREAIDALSST